MNPVVGRTMAFSVLSLSQLAHAFNMRARGARRGSRLLPAALVCAALQCAVLLFPPLRTLFDGAPLTGEGWLLTAAFSLAPALVMRLQEAVNRRFSGRRR